MLGRDGLVVALRVDQDHDTPGALEPAPHGFGGDAVAEVRAAFDGPDIGGRGRVARGPSLLVQACLGKDAAEFGLASAGLAVGGLAANPFEGLAPQGHARGVIGHVEGVDRLGWPPG